MFSRHVETRILVEASAPRVFEILTDFDAYPRWNRVLRLSLKGEARAGTRARLHVQGSPLPIPVRLEVVEPGRELRWGGGVPGMMFGSHYFELRPVPGAREQTELVHAETFSGLMVPLMWPLMRPQLERLYSAINDGLAAFVREA